jgi:hypothetical protein
LSGLFVFDECVSAWRGAPFAVRQRSCGSKTPDDIRVFLLCRSQHVEERVRPLREARRNLVMIVAFFALVEVTVVLGAFLFVECNRRFELGDGRARFVVRDDAALTEAFADYAHKVLGEIIQHHHVGAGAAFESNQHDCSLFIMVD